MEYHYSTDPDWCSRCKHIPCQCQSKAQAAAKPRGAGGVAKMRREMRRGKPVIVLLELGLAEAALRDLLKEIQKSCGAGGSLKDGTLEIQGDHRERIEQILQQRGLKVKRAGG